MASRRLPLAPKTTRREQAALEATGVMDSDFFRALAEPARIELLRVLLVHGPCDVAAIAERLPQDRSVLSRHLQVLLRAGLVARQRDGRHRIYRVRGSVFIQRVETLLASLRRIVPACCPDPEPG
jgi:DNA-binding transcriptional ArsR family regulator